MFQGLADRKKLICSLLLICGFLSTLPATSANPPDCLSYAYTSDDNHKFLLESNSNLYNERLYIVHNCDQVSIYVDDMFIQSSTNNFSISIQPGIHNITIDHGNYSIDFDEVNFLESRFNWFDDYTFLIENIEGKEFTNQEVKRLSNWVAFGTGILIFCLSVGVYWRLINSYVDRNYIEEIA